MKGLTLKIIGILLGISVLLFLYAGCSFNKRHSACPEPMPQLDSQTLPVAQPVEPAGFAPDSLWNDQLPFGVFYSDARARGVNDIVTILIVENSTAENSATTSGAKKSEISAGIPNFFGQETRLVSRLGFPQGTDASSLLSANLDKTFNADGKTARSGKILATLSARVVRVLPNGNLVILGQREISVNNEKETIFVSGIIRGSDIQADNTIVSTKIADARILYGGKGQISEDQRAGWAGRIISVLWPF
ncbi:MAG: flagellar basal body L-ring protein FlgH [Candidatus Coatesbacteria bacterium]|nr:flagellar basal body L-ring protein FlgH [Candidatus Coatesbacteria bacterium]